MSKETYCGQPCCFTTVANTAKKMLLIELTNKCNLACPYCHSRPNEGGNNALGYERLVRLLDECRENNFDTVIVSGGEPLVSPDVFRFAEEIRNRGFNTDLCTNGILVTESKAETIAKYFPSVTVTLDTIDPEVYGKMKNCDKRFFYKAYDGIKYLTAAGVRVGVTIVLTRYNFMRIDEVINELKQLGVKKVSLLRLFNTAGSNDYEFEYSEENVKLMLEKAMSTEGIKVKLKGWDFDTPKFPLCSAGANAFAVDHEGYLLPCILIRDHSAECNLADHSLSEAMNGAGISGFRNKIEHLNCESCSYNNDCKKGCPASSYNINGTITPDIRCGYRKETDNAD